MNTLFATIDEGDVVWMIFLLAHLILSKAGHLVKINSAILSGRIVSFYRIKLQTSLP